jgi:hydrogenase-4 component E
MFFLIKAVGAPYFLRLIMKTIEVKLDIGAYIPTPIALHTGIILMGVSYLLARELPGAYVSADATYGAAASLSLIFVGVLMMVTRRLALSQIVGFLVLENGIFMFTLVKTHGMPLAVEMGILLDVLVVVMIAGLLLFRIKKSFEHIDVTKLTELRD